MNIILFEKLTKTNIQNGKTISLTNNNIFTLPWQIIIVLAIILSAVVILTLLVASRRQKRAPGRKQKFTEMPKINRQEELGMETEPMKVKNMLVELEEIKGVGPKTAQKLKAADINHVSDLAISSAKFLSQKTGLSEKSLSNWIEQAKRMHRRTEH